jgi:hypothetical protein
MLLIFSHGFSSKSQSVDLSKIYCENYDQQIYNDPTVDYSKFKSFSVISINQYLKKEQQPFQEKQLEFFLSNFIYNQRSLEYIPLNDSLKPDLLVVYDYSNDFKEQYIAPQTVTIPYWRSGTTMNTTVNTSTSGMVNVTGDVNITSLGHSSDQTNITSTTPGEWTIRQVQKPGYTIGKFYPSLSIIIYNTSNNTKVWEGVGTGTSYSKDFRLSCQFIMTHLGLNIPIGSFQYDDLATGNNGRIGINFILFNSDGQNFYPVITTVEDNTPASSSNLKFGDIILSINDISTSNKSWEQLNSAMRGIAGTQVRFVLERNGRIIKKTVTKIQR